MRISEQLRRAHDVASPNPVLEQRSTLLLRQRSAAAFTIIEVMIAMGIFFMAIFAILSLVSSNLRIARRLQEPQVDAGMLVAQLSLTNQLQEGSDSGDFGELYPGYKWESQITEVGTNGLFQVEYLVTGPTIRGQDPVQSHLSVLMWRPNSVAGLSSGTFGRGGLR
jgi:type II secretory pathway pseudopilin PulG